MQSDTFYEEKAAGVLAPMLAKGLPVNFYRLGRSSVFDPVAGGVTSSPALANFQQLVGLSLPASKSTTSGFDDGVVEDLLRGRLRFFIFGPKQPDGQDAVFRPQAGDVILYDNAFWTLQGMTMLAPTGIPVLFKLAGKQGCDEFMVAPGVPNNALIISNPDNVLEYTPGIPLEADL